MILIIVSLPLPLAPLSTPLEKLLISSSLTSWKPFRSILISSRCHFRHCRILCHYNTPSLSLDLLRSMHYLASLVVPTVTKISPPSNLTSYIPRYTVAIVFDPSLPPLVPRRHIIAPVSRFYVHCTFKQIKIRRQIAKKLLVI